jgi:hypothetical protein
VQAQLAQHCAQLIPGKDKGTAILSPEIQPRRAAPR